MVRETKWVKFCTCCGTRYSDGRDDCPHCDGSGHARTHVDPLKFTWCKCGRVEPRTRIALDKRATADGVTCLRCYLLDKLVDMEFAVNWQDSSYLKEVMLNGHEGYSTWTNEDLLDWGRSYGIITNEDEE